MAIVKGKQRLCTTAPLSGFVVESVNGTPFYNRRPDFERIIAKLVVNERHRRLFAMPYFDAQLHGLEWFIPVSDEEPVRLSLLKGTDQYRKLHLDLDIGLSFYKQLIAGSSPVEVAYLACLLKNVDEEVLDDITFAVGDQPVIACWGLKPTNGRSPADAVTSDVDDRRLHRVVFNSGTNGRIEGTSSFMRKHGFRLMPGRDVPAAIAAEGYRFVGWLPCDPNGVEVNKDLEFEANFERTAPAVPVAAPPPVPEEPEIPALPPIEEPVAPAPPPMHKVQFLDAGRGVLSGAPAELMVAHGSIMEPSQIPYVTGHEGYRFAGWSSPVGNPIVEDTTFVAQYDVIPLSWWERMWASGGCLRWLLAFLLALMFVLLCSLVLTRCAGCTPVWHHGVVTDGAGTPVEVITLPGGRVIDDNGNARGVRDITVDEEGNPIDGWDGSEPVTPPIVGDDGEPISEVQPSDPSNPNSPQVMKNRLNIFFEDDNPDLQKWVDSFKRAYTGPGYKVVGVDRNSNWIQIEVPENERAKVARELPSKITSPKFIVVDETVMRNNSLRPTSSQVTDKPGWHISAVRAPQAWQITKGSSDVTVAVIDDGIDLNHELFQSRIVNAYNIFRGDDHLSAGVGHGTHVAGLAVGGTSRLSQGVAGMAPECRLMPVQVFDNGHTTISCVIRGIMYAVQKNADVVNISIGTAYPPQLGEVIPVAAQQQVAQTMFKNEERVWNWVFAQAKKKNTILVFASGNSDLLAAIEPQLRSSTTINVAAIGPNFNVTDWSNYGNGATVSAPGEGILSSMPSGRYDFQDGTSMAAPIVTGVVALMKSVNKNLTVDQVRQALVSSGRPASGGHQAGPIVQADKALMKIRG